MSPCLEYVTSDGSQSSLFANPLFTSPLYYTTVSQLAALQAQYIQLAQLQTFTNPIWLPPFVWHKLNSLYSTVTGNQVNGTNSLYEKQHLQVLNGVIGHVRKEVGSESYCSAVECSVVKTTGNVDKRTHYLIKRQFFMCKVFVVLKVQCTDLSRHTVVCCAAKKASMPHCGYIYRKKEYRIFTHA